MTANTYCELFGSSAPSNLSIAKLTFTDNVQTHSIYRKAVVYKDHAMEGKVAITKNSMEVLSKSSKRISGRDVIVSKSNRWQFYSHHPNDSVRSASIIANVSLLVGAMSLLFTLFQNILDK